ncbi:MAG: molybdenum cofactor guanylyltransferase [Anaerolinea sp.]|nr:molybdenum cofactor guanylyltransferase [Anaerolinea sp.]
MAETMTTLQAAILAGGRSRRMGQDKSFLVLDGKPMIQHVIDQLRKLDLDVMLITNAPSDYAVFGVPMFSDELPGSGSLGGLYTALVKAEAAHVLCVACDMPYLNTTLLEWLVSQRHGYDAVVPRTGDTTHSLHAVYAQSCRPLILEQLEQRNLRISDCLAALKVRYVAEDELRAYDPELRSLLNLNTPDDVSRARSGNT